MAVKTLIISWCAVKVSFIIRTQSGHPFLDVGHLFHRALNAFAIAVVSAHSL